ncbi:MAG TPA: hypothetical protein VF624_18590, partial [Tepidisphaeraceae bacterium]
GAELPTAFVFDTRLPLPRDVRHALQAIGYIDPPSHVWLIERSLENARADAEGVVVRYAGDPTEHRIALRR